MTTLKDYCEKYNIQFDYYSGYSKTHFKNYPVIVPQKAQELFNLPELFFISDPSLFYINESLSQLLSQNKPHEYCECDDCKAFVPREIILNQEMVNYLGYGQVGEQLDNTCIQILTRKMGNISFVDSDTEGPEGPEDEDEDDDDFVNQHSEHESIKVEYDEDYETKYKEYLGITQSEELNFHTLFHLVQDTIKENGPRYKLKTPGVYVICEEDGEYSDYDAEPIATTRCKKRAKRYIRDLYKILLSTSFEDYKNKVRIYNSNLLINRNSEFPKYYIKKVPDLDV